MATGVSQLYCGMPEALIRRGDRCPDGSVHPAWAAPPMSVQIIAARQGLLCKPQRGPEFVAEAVRRWIALVGVHPTMILQWKRALPDRASDIFERGGRMKAPEVTEETIRELHAKIGELAVANDFCRESSSPGPGSGEAGPATGPRAVPNGGGGPIPCPTERDRAVPPAVDSRARPSTIRLGARRR